MRRALRDASWVALAALGVVLALRGGGLLEEGAMRRAVAALIGVALAALLVAIAGRFAARGRARPARAILRPAEAALVTAAADAYFPPGGPIPLSGTAAGVVGYFAAYLARSGRRERALMRLLVHFTELSPLVFGPRRGRFSRLSQVDRLRFLQGAAASRLYLRRIACLSLRALLTMAYLANEEVARSMGARLDTDPFGLRARGAAPTPTVSETRAVPGAVPSDAGVCSSQREAVGDGTEAAE